MWQQEVCTFRVSRVLMQPCYKVGFSSVSCLVYPGCLIVSHGYHMGPSLLASHKQSQWRRFEITLISLLSFFQCHSFFPPGPPQVRMRLQYPCSPTYMWLAPGLTNPMWHPEFPTSMTPTTSSLIICTFGGYKSNWDCLDCCCYVVRPHYIYLINASQSMPIPILLYFEVSLYSFVYV